MTVRKYDKPAVLILAAGPDAAVDMGMRLRAVGYVAIEPRREETGIEAMFRLRPTVVMIQMGREELAAVRMDVVVKAVGAGVVVFGTETPDLHETARVHGAHSVSMNATSLVLRAAIEIASEM
jgi:hypothetical protein